ncbi:PEPxxWA-CTERM sorting domain-containing protein [Sandarakinorhabdus oryzae]|uniref:PEPxxWA-CTERM sorting domain-containing protein n=1 Tax=Sandarakinorhabdus oryzae TaxID=2675220 RepID=UPI0012E221B1|nr:PEPxxWA-CTERM sorting domain-containing protein [Sandarakinorhabdus oryzae]
MRKMMLTTLSLTALLVAGAAQAQVKSYFEFKNPVKTIQEDPLIAGPDLLSAPVMNAPGGLTIGFEGISQFQNAANGRNFIPPDTMGAVGTTQFVELINGGFAVYSKATGAQLQYKTDTAFWASAGGQQTNGDPRVMFNATMNRWVALSFGADVRNIQIAVSDTDDALGGWKSTVFTGYDPATLFRPVADYPTLAMDANAIYIGTNNFAGTTAAGVQSWRGTTLNIIPLADIFAAGGPSAANVKQFNNYFNTPGQVNNFAGFAIQGVNSKDASTTGNIFTVSATDYGVQRYDVLNAGTAGATLTAVTDIATGSYAGLCGGTNCAARQPGQAGTGSAATGLRNIDALDDRISSSVYEVNGRIYAVQTIMKAGNDHTQVRYYVIDSATNAILSQGEIGDNTFDYYQGSLAVNDKGQVVISYNRSGGIATGDDGRISIFAQAFETRANGKLVAKGDALLLKQSVTGGYLNGNTEASGAPAGRQRWGDYSQTSLDPLDQNMFWVIGQFAREANTPANGYPTGTGFSRWGTYIAGLSFAELAGVPEPQSWIMMLFGFGLVGATLRRKQALEQVAA